MKRIKLFHQIREKSKDISSRLNQNPFLKKVISIWKTGKIQKTSRITYDVTWNVILFILIVGFIGSFFVAGLGAGYFASLVKDEPVRAFAEMKNSIYNYEETSKLYFADNVYLGDVRAELYREETTLDRISPTLIQAVIATEDEHFEEHRGIVPKAIFRAMYQEFTNASTQTGGSTLTQQLIKNQILTNEVSFERKAKEMLLAIRLEQFFEKDEILEAYLNIVPFGRNSSGGNIAGIQTAAQGVFGIDADELNLAQAAFLAGLPQSPSYYTPFKNTGGLKDEEGIQPGIKRMKTVLYRMLDMGYITQEEYEEALNYDIVADFRTDIEKPYQEYPILTAEIQERATEIIKVIKAEEDGYSEEDLQADPDLNNEYRAIAAQAIQSEGYKIHSTIDKQIYDVFQEVAANYQYYGKDKHTTLPNGETILQSIQAAAVLYENKTGRIISFLGNRNFSEENQTNYATAKRSIGSTSKPTVVYAPAMEFGYVQPSTTIVDEPVTFAGGYSPKNYGGANYGTVTVREALAKSLNIPAVITYNRILSKDPAQFMEKMGVTSLTESDHHILSFALGASEYGISVEENINTYTTFANNGKFIDGYMIEKITTADDEVVYEHESKPVEVFSPQTAYLTLDMMRDVINRGTGSYVKSRLKYRNVDWAGKTGTSQEYHDAWFIATNPNVTFGTWLGYEYPDSIYDSSYPLSYSQRNLNLWAQLINAATDINPDLLAPSKRFSKPDGVVSQNYCAISGKLPSELCKQAGLVKSDIFNSEFLPNEVDDSLIAGSYIMVDGEAVPIGENTPKEFVEGNGIMFNPEWLRENGFSESDINKLRSRIDGDKWNKISAPNKKTASATVKNNNAAPEAPAVNHSNKKLRWSKPNSGNIVGYRVYGKSDENGKYELLESTTSTEYQMKDKYNFYYVKAVDYNGNESDASKVIELKNKKNNDKKNDDKNKNKNKNNDEDKNNAEE